MSFRINTNIASLQSQEYLRITSENQTKTIGRVTSGLRILSSGDDAAGLSIANSFRSDQAVLRQGIRNANDGLSVLDIRNGALDNIGTLLDRMATLATQSASAGFTGNRTQLNAEFTSVISEITREVGVASLGTAQGFSVFVSNDGANGTVGGTIGAADTTTLGIASLSIATSGDAATAVTAIQTAVGTLGSVVGSIGALQNRLQYAIGLAQFQNVATKASESRIRDANMAEESANLTRWNILTQSGIASLAQANQQTSSVLSLLR